LSVSFVGALVLMGASVLVEAYGISLCVCPNSCVCSRLVRAHFARLHQATNAIFGCTRNILHEAGWSGMALQAPMGVVGVVQETASLPAQNEGNGAAPYRKHMRTYSGHGILRTLRSTAGLITLLGKGRTDMNKRIRILLSLLEQFVSSGEGTKCRHLAALPRHAKPTLEYLTLVAKHPLQ
jgi:hypothetical protein